MEIAANFLYQFSPSTKLRMTFDFAQAEETHHYRACRDSTLNNFNVMVSVSTGWLGSRTILQQAQDDLEESHNWTRLSSGLSVGQSV